jgi:PAS domain-containing protein
MSDFASATRPGDRGLDRPVVSDSRRVVGPDDDRPGLSRLLASREVNGDAFDALIECLPLGVALVDRNGRLVYANAAARAFPLADLAELPTMVGHALLAETEMREELRELRGPNRSRRWLTITAVPVRDRSGRVGAAWITLVDTTTNIQASEWQPIVDSLVSL